MPIQTPVESSISNANQKIYREFYNVLKLYLTRRNTIPITKTKSAAFREVLIPGDDTIHRLLNQADLKKLFQKNYFIDPAIVQDDYTELRNYFTDIIQIKTGDAESFAFRIIVTPDFLEGKALKWLMKFYPYVHAHQRLWDVQHRSNYFNLRNAPIILTQNNELKAPYSETHELAVFLPHGKSSNLPVVHKNLLKKPACKLFIKDIGITEPELLDEIETNIIPKFTELKKLPKNEYYSYFRKILLVYHNADDKRKEQILESLKDRPFIYAANIYGEKKFLKGEEVYFYSDILNLYFSRNSDVYYLEPKLLLNFTRKYPTTFRTILLNLGLNEFPRIRTNQEGKISIDGFDSFISTINVEKSKAFIKLVIGMPKQYLTDGFVTFISKAKWLYNKRDIVVAASNIRFTKIYKKYNFRNDELLSLESILKFAKANKNQEQNLLDWRPAVSPRRANSRVLKAPKASHFQLPENFSLIAQQFAMFPTDKSSTKNLASYSEADMERIQEWSMKYVLTFLKAKYKTEKSDVSVINESEIIVKNDNHVEQHIFVSGKTALMSSYPIDGAQFLRMFSALDAVEDTYLYLVSSAGSEDASIKIYPNPLKLFQQGSMQINSKLWFNPL